MRPILCLVVDRKILRRPLREAIDAAVRAGVDWVQVRDRELEALELLKLAREIGDCARAAAQAGERPVRVIVNRRIDVALATQADGVQLGRDALSAGEARALLGAKAVIGVSTHSPSEVEAAAAEKADYVQLAAIFAPLSKPAQAPPLGLDALAAASGHGIPVIAQGGIDADNCRLVMASGAAGIAVTGSILMSDDPGAAAAGLRAALDAA